MVGLYVSVCSNGVDVLGEKIAFRRKHRVIDLTSERVLSQKLEEARIECMPEEKVRLWLLLSLSVHCCRFVG